MENLVTGASLSLELNSGFQSLAEKEGPRKVVCQRNPLQIDLILNQVLSYLPLKSLKNLRLVNQTWNARILPLIRNKMKEIKNGVLIRSEDFPRFCAAFENAEVFPLPKLSIDLAGISRDHCFKFFTQHGSDIQSLALWDEEYRYSVCRSAIGISDKMRHILKHTPNLKTLSLHLDALSVEKLFIFYEYEEAVRLSHVESLRLSWHQSLSKGFLEGLFAILPNVKVLELSGINQDWEVFFGAFQELNHLHTMDCNEYIRLHSDVFWRALVTSQISLKLRVLTMSLKFPVQLDFLRTQSECLEVLNLRLIMQEYPVREKHQFPVMQNLKSLRLKQLYDCKFCPILPIESHQVPTLRKICFAPQLFNTRFIGDSIFTSVDEIVLNGKITAPVDRNIAKLSFWFPNLRKLRLFEITINDNPFEHIVKYLVNIEDLECGILMESEMQQKKVNWLMSGFPSELHWALTLTPMGERLVFPALPSSIQPPGPALTDLKNLKRLVLTFDARGKENLFARIDEVGVYMSFLRMSPQLRLTLRGDFSIPDHLATKLANHFQTSYLIPTEPKRKR